MIAVIQIGGHQALVSEGDVLEIDKLDSEAGKTVSFEALLVSEEDGTNCKIGAPLLEGVRVEAKVLEHDRAKKIRVFKMKPRKRYRRTKGHRQDYTVIEITKIGSGTKKSEPKKESSEKKTDKKSTSQKPKQATESKKPTTKKKTVAKKKKKS
ncbi:50S ribosomal protein L21 [Candidatus Gracilibacteria bacterium]|nr:50S ribosomal protein L21 [Candidatus Gracilibacteria bacterium]MCF7819283.1 50S ribosomal protein L21 [Candidatus Gracilibacteria bacterium]